MAAMPDSPLLLVGLGGEPHGRLRVSALALVVEAEERARRDHLAKTIAISSTLRSHVERAGFRTTDAALAEAAAIIGRVRRGESLASIPVRVLPDGGGAVGPAVESSLPQRTGSPMPSTPASAVSFFETERVFPDPAARAWYERLVGLDEHKERLLVELEMLLYPEQLEAWSRKHHGGKVLRLCDLYRNRVPLVLLEGDVGTGKTALAETVGDALARRMGNGKRVHLLKLNTQVRGTGLVGEMSDLIAQAFAQAEARARDLRGEPVLLLIDEADALAASRATQQMHHEDKAGLNTVLQRLDNLRLTRLPIAALFITNRPEALDPAVRRRAALDLHFERPADPVRAQILSSAVPELSLRRSDLDELVTLTGPGVAKNRGIGFTASDLTDRLLPGALRSAFTHKRSLTPEDLIAEARLLTATPRFGGADGES